MKSAIVIACIILVLIMALIITIKVAISQSSKIKELKSELEKERKIAKQKDKVNTGDDVADFNNSIDLLQNYSKRRN